jgi:hypothetical protein
MTVIPDKPFDNETRTAMLYHLGLAELELACLDLTGTTNVHSFMRLARRGIQRAVALLEAETVS